MQKFDSKFQEACARGDFERVALMIAAVPKEQRADYVNAQDDQGHTVFHTAKPAVFPELLSAGANPNARNVRGDTVLHLMVEFDHGEVQPAHVSAVLGAGADPQATNYFGHTPLHVAQAESIPLLLAAVPSDQRANYVNAQDCEGYTALHYVVSRHGLTGSRELFCVQTLLAAGADPQATTDDGRTPLHLARAETTAHLLAAVPVEQRADYVNAQDHHWGNTALHEFGDQDRVQALLAAGANPQIRNHLGDSPTDLMSGQPDLIALIDKHELQRAAVDRIMPAARRRSM